MTGLLSGFRLLTGGNTLVSLISWLLIGLAPSCLSGAGIASGRICAGICCEGEGAMRSGAAVAVGVIRSALAAHDGMATFAEAGVSVA